MARSNKPMIWLPFAVGGTLAAFVLPAIMLIVLLASLGSLSELTLGFERVHGFVANPFARFMLLLVLGLPLWHAAHRLRMTLQDLGVRRPFVRRLTARLCYGFATLATLILLYSLLPGS